MTQKQADKLLVAFAWLCLVVSLAGWPVSAVTWAKEEPPFVLGLSWFAIIQGAVIFLVQTYSRKDQHENGNK